MGKRSEINFKPKALRLPRVAIFILVIVIVVFLYQPPASIEIENFNWLTLSCWIEPCALLFPPRFPWERFSSVEILNREITEDGGPPRRLALAIGLDGTIVVGDSAGRVYRLTGSV